MVRVQDQRDIECPLRRRRGLLAVQHKQEIRGVGERAVGLYNGMSLTNTVVSSNDHRDLRSDANRLVHIGFGVVALFLGIVERQRRDRGAQHVHG